MKKFAVYRTDGTCELVEREKLDYDFIVEVVGGGIEFYKTSQGDTIYLNETGRLDNLPTNPFFFEDIRGDVIVTGGVDDEGNDEGLPNDYEMLKKASLPDELFVKGNKFTIFAIGESLPMRFHIKITTQGYEQKGKPIFKAYRERKYSVWTQDVGDILIFRWDLPFSIYRFGIDHEGDFSMFSEMRFPKVLEGVFNDGILYIKNISDKEIVLWNQLEETDWFKSEKLKQSEFIVRPNEALAYGLGDIMFINNKFVGKKYEEFL